MQLYLNPTGRLLDALAAIVWSPALNKTQSENTKPSQVINTNGLGEVGLNTYHWIHQIACVMSGCVGVHGDEWRCDVSMVMSGGVCGDEQCVHGDEWRCDVCGCAHLGLLPSVLLWLHKPVLLVFASLRSNA